MLGECSWGYDEKLENLINKISYTIHETQHKEWFIQIMMFFNSV